MGGEFPSLGGKELFDHLLGLNRGGFDERGFSAGVSVRWPPYLFVKFIKDIAYFSGPIPDLCNQFL